MSHMKTIANIFFLTLIIIFMACSNTKPKYDDRIERAYNLVRTNADSTFRLLSKMSINDFEEEHDKAYYAYTYTVTHYWLSIHPANDSLIKIAVDYYSAHGDSAMKAKTFYYAAKVYDSIKDRRNAIHYFNKALDATPFDSVSMKLLFAFERTFMITSDRPDSESYELYEKIKDYSVKSSSNIHSNYYYIAALVQQGWIHLVNQEYSKAIIKYKEADEFAVKNNMGYARFATLNRLACCYLKEGNYEKAMSYAKEAEKYVESVTDKSYINSTLADIYIKTGEFDKAIKCVELSADTSTNQKSYIYYRRLWNLYAAMGDYKVASECGIKCMDYWDKYYAEYLKNNAAEYQAMYDKTELELQKSELEVQSERQKVIVIVCLFVLVVVAIVSLLVISIRKMKTMEMLKTKDDMMAELTETLQSKINTLQEMRAQLAENVNELEESRRQREDLKRRIFDMNEVVKKVNEFKKVKNSEVTGRSHILTDEELNILSEMTDFLNDGIMTKLRTNYPNLTKDDLHLCCLLSIGLSGAKIALLLDTSDDALKKRKSRLLRTKLGVTDNTETLDEYLSHL